MIRDFIDRFRSNDGQIFEEGETYYNADVGDRFTVKGVEPDFMLRYHKFGETLWYDRDIYRMKYKDGIIKEVDDD